MRLITFEIAGQQRIGAIENNTVLDLTEANKLYLAENPDHGTDAPSPFPSTMIDFLASGEPVKHHASRILAYVGALPKERLNQSNRENVLRSSRDVHILPPVPVPPKIICLGLNYRDHAEEGRVPIPGQPLLFSKPSTTIVGPDDFIVYPKISSQVDYEIELAAVICRRGKEIAESHAFEYVGGYTIFNDISARDIQFGDKQWFRGKSFDTFAPTGPSMVLSDQVPDPHHLKMELRVNGEIRQRSTTANMIFRIPQIVAFISRVMTLQPGDIIATGTPAGVGFYAKPDKKLLKPGDIVEAEIECLGILRNRVVSAQ